MAVELQVKESMEVALEDFLAERNPSLLVKMVASESVKLIEPVLVMMIE